MKKLIIVYFGFILMSSTCQKEPNQHYCLKLINSSTKNINLFLNDSLKCFLLNNQHYAINLKARESINEFYCMGSVSWENKLSNGDKFYILYYNRDSILNINCDSVEKYQPFYKKQELTLDYLNQNNWTITYP